MKIYYNPKLKEKARKLRKEGTLAEVLLWDQLKSKKLGYKFTRQKPIDEYIVDFYCQELQLIIEIDGIKHNDKAEYDKERQNKLESIGLTVKRILDEDVRNDLDSVIRMLLNWIEEIEDRK